MAKKATKETEAADRLKPALSQDPHALREPKENNLEMAIGHEVRAFRKKLGITVADLAQATSLSLGMLSKIENGITSPSLTTLQALSHALGVPVTAFFRRFEEERAAVFVKAGEGLEIERRDAAAAGDAVAVDDEAGALGQQRRKGFGQRRRVLPVNGKAPLVEQASLGQ